jgi:hypothetical protein
MTITTALFVFMGCNGPEDSNDEDPGAANSLFEVYPPEGAQGARQTVVIEATESTFRYGETSVHFGQGIVVDSVTVDDGWTLIADVIVEPDAELGRRDLQISVGDLSYGVPRGYRVVGETFSITPDRGKIGESMDLVIEGHQTQWKDGRTWVNFGDGVDVLEFQVLSQTLAEATISIEADAAPGLRDVYTEDGSKIVTLYQGFQVDRVALAAAWEPELATQGQQITFTVYGRDTDFQQGVTDINFFDREGLNPDIRVEEITVLDSENLWGRMTLSNAAELGQRDVLITTDGEGVRIPDAFEVLGGEWSLEEVAVSLTFNVTRGIDADTGELRENVRASSVFFIPLDPPCGGGGAGSGSAPQASPYDNNVVGPITGSGSGGGEEDCPNPTTVSAGDYVWLESDKNVVTLEKEVDPNSGMIAYIGRDLTIDDYVPDNMYDLHLQGDPEGLEEEIVEAVLPTVPCNWYMESPQLWGPYVHDRATDFNYTWTNTEGGYGACTYPDAIFYTEINGTTFNGTDDPGMAASYPWDDGDHSYTPDQLLFLDPGQVYFIAYSYIEGREFGLRESIYQTNQGNSYIYLQASMILE